MDDYQKVIRLSYAAAESSHAKAKLKHTRKLDRLRDTQDKHRELCLQGLERWLINLTNRPLSKTQEDTLRLGLNFTPAPTKLPLVDTKVAVEERARQLNKDEEDLRGRVCGILWRVKPPKVNLSNHQRKALKELRSLENEVTLPADKGNTTVMMTREDYDTKMRGKLSTVTYKQLKKDPTTMQEGRLRQKLKELEKKGEIRGGLYHRLRPSGSQPSGIYSLLKIHKDGIPLRPIVSCIGTPSYQLSKHITSLISPSGRQDSFTCEEFQALSTSDGRPEN